jgi:hypothetical protein
MSDREALQSFLEKWQQAWPEWTIAEVFLPAKQHELARAWLALVGELADAAWSGEDATPGAAKLAWWAEELQGWSRGGRRHPLGMVLQKQAVAWADLGALLPALAASRTLTGDLSSAVIALEPVARRLMEAAEQLFQCKTPAEAQDIAVLLLMQRALRMPASGVHGALTASGVLQQPRLDAGTRVERLQAVLLRERLRQRARGLETAGSRWRCLWQCWRAARD